MKNILFLLLLSTQLAFSQDWRLKSSIPIEADIFIGVDAYKYRYWIKDAVLKKQVNGVVFSFGDKRLGSIQSVDMINPLSVYVFYQEAQTLVILDNKFNEIDRVRFSDKADFMEIVRMGNAGNRQLWVVNAANQRLEVIDYRSKKTRVVSPSFSGEGLVLYSDYKYCYIQTKETLYTYNTYGNVLHKLDITNFDDFFPSNKGILMKNKKGWYFYDANKETPDLIPPLNIETESIKTLFYTREAYYVFDGTHLHTYIAEK